MICDSTATSPNGQGRNRSRCYSHGNGTPCDDRAPTAAAAASTAPTMAAAVGTPGNMVNIELKNFAIAVDATNVRAGSVTIRVKNDVPSPHSFMVHIGADGKGIPEIDGGATAMVTLDLTPGTYTFRCTVPAHDLLGMKGTLTVQ
jgi:plastocyanin